MRLAKSPHGEAWHVLRSDGRTFCGVIAEHEYADSQDLPQDLQHCQNCDDTWRAEGRAGRRPEPKIKRPRANKGTAYEPRCKVRW